MKGLRKSLAVMVAAVLLLTLVPALALAAEEGTVTGTFTVNAPPTVGTITISPATMTPQYEWTEITVPVTDDNTLADVNVVHVEVFYDSGGTDPSAPGSAHFQTCAILTWTRGGAPWAIDQGTGTTWAINTGGCSAGSDSATTDNWVFSFKVGTVATESPDTDDWDIYGKATDSVPQSGENYLRDVEMDWYGEITVNTTSVDWGSVILGMSFAEGSPSEVEGISVTYISNGAYDEQISATSPWKKLPEETPTITLQPSGSPGAGEFSLKADDTGTMPGNGYVTIYPAFLTIDDTGIQTTESPTPVTTNSIWLALGSTGITSGVEYSGTIYYQIADGVL